MALTLSTVARKNGVACEHLAFDMSLDLKGASWEGHKKDVAVMGNDWPGGYKELLLLLLARYRLEQGVLVENLPTVVSIT